jgi:AmmeMemoRadiSam system protein A
VSIKTLRGDLRGCIGTILPTQPSLDLEIISNAIAASTRDPRFPPMKASELDDVTLSVDVLSLPEPADPSALDPALWGVIVSRGALRGVLLPDLEGVDTVEQQLGIAARKAGIRKIDEAVTIERFRVDRYKE